MSPLAAGILFFLIALIVVIIASISIKLEKVWAERRSKAEAESANPSVKSPNELSSDLVTWMAAGIKDLQERIPLTNSIQELQQRIPLKRKQSELPKEFLTWADRTFTDHQDITAWLHALSEEGLQMLVGRLSEFCSDMGFDLSWLVKQQLNMNPKVEQATSDIVLHYCRACYQAVLVHEEISVLEIYLSLIKMPHSRENRLLSQRLYTHLVKKGLAPRMPSELALSADQERQSYIIEAILDAAQKTPTTFNQILSDVVFNLDSPKVDVLESSEEGVQEIQNGSSYLGDMQDGVSTNGMVMTNGKVNANELSS